MTPDAQRQWSAALLKVQELNDQFLTSNWSQLDWATLGRWGSDLQGRPPPKRLSEKEVALVLTLRQHGILPEYFPAGHVAYLMFVLIQKERAFLHS